MKKTILTLFTFCFAIYVNAQISHGGSPKSFELGTSINKDVPEVIMPAYDQATIDAEDAVNDQYKDIPWRFGYNHMVDINPQNSGLWEELGRDSKLWRLQITSPGAKTINLTFDRYFIPEGAELFIYNEDRSQILGALTHENNKPTKDLGTTLLNGETVIIEYYQPYNVDFEGELSISKVTHGYRDLLDSPNLEKGFGSSGSCNNNVVCPEGLPWQDQIRSVACIVVNGNENCTGALINNTCEDETPYFLTANHCLGGNVSTWVFRFNWESPDCSPSVNGPYNYTVSGATQRANNGGSDFALLELSSAPPSSYNVFYAGWDNSGTAPTNSIAIHHPSGDVKKISFDDDPASTATWSSAATWHISDWEDGTTEPGSSGSPLFNQDGRVIGQLYGGTASCSNNIDDYYGRFDVSWNDGGSSNNQLVDWLDGCATGAVTIDGFDPNSPSANVDANLLSVNSPENGAETCDNVFTPSVTVKNKGLDTLTDISVSYQLDGGTVESYNWAGILATNESDIVTFPSITTSVGTHTITSWTSNPNSTVDLNTSNDTSSAVFEVISPATSMLPVVDDFESGTFPQTGWSINNPDNWITWEEFNGAGGFGNSSNCIRANNFQDDFEGERDQLVTPYYDLSPILGGTITMVFNVAYARYSSNYHDSLLVKMSRDCGATWEILYAKGNTNLSTNGGTSVTNQFVPTSTEWRHEILTLDSLAGEPRVQFAFENYSGYGNAVYLDDINIYYTVPNAAPVANFNSTGYNCENSTIQFTDVSLNGPTSWQWSFENGSPSTSTNQNPQVSFANSGNYNVELISSNSFGVDTTNTTITISPSPLISVTTTSESSSGSSDGSATVVASNGNSPYTYLWSTGATGTTVNNLTSGSYSVAVSDANGCTSTENLNVVISSVFDFNIASQVKIYPNPTNGQLTIEFKENQSADISLFNVLGKLVYSDNFNDQNIKSLDLSNLPKGIYVLQVSNQIQQISTKVILE